MTSALLRRGAGGVGTRLAGYSRGGGAGSRRWMALTGKRLLKQHDISWNESTHQHTLALLPCTQTGTSLYLTISHLTLQVSSQPPCPAQNNRSKAFFICSLLTWTVSGRHQGSFTSPITFSPPPSLPVFYPLSLRGFLLNQTPLMNHEADICKKATTTLM